MKSQTKTVFDTVAHGGATFCGRGGQNFDKERQRTMEVIKNLKDEVLFFILDTIGTIWTMMKISERPLIVSIASVLVILLVLNSFATVYTLCAGNVLDTFCPKKLPVLRNFICSSSDLLQDSKDLAVPSKSTFTPVYVHYLESEDSTISYKLTYYLSLWEQAIRLFRASLPRSEYPPPDQEHFYDMFTAYVEGSVRATDDAHRFHAHIRGAIHRHESDTQLLVRKLQDHGLPGNVTLHENGPLARSMEFFNHYNMVYLPLGLEPFQQNGLQQATLAAVDLMKAHVGATMQRLSDDIMMINALQMSLNDLALSSDAIQFEANRLYAQNRKASHMQTPPWWEILRDSFEYKLNKDRQTAWLQDLRPVVTGLAGRLRVMATEFERAAVICKGFRERLSLEGRAARDGLVSDWVTEQSRELSDGLEDLQFELKNFKDGKTRFDEGIIRQAFPETLLVEAKQSQVRGSR